MRRLVNEAYGEALRFIKEHRKDLKRIAELLIEKEVIFGEDLENILGKRPEQKRGDKEAETEKKAEETVKQAQLRKKEANEKQEEEGSSLGGNGQETSQSSSEGSNENQEEEDTEKNEGRESDDAR